MLRIISMVGLLVFLALPTAAAPGETATSGSSVLQAFLKDVRKSTLPNGLTLITKSQQGTGVVAINTWVKAGYFNEADEIAGMAHLFEHMFFKGSKAFPGAEQISHELAAIGGQTNAGTIYDSTNYYFVVPKESFRRAAEIQSDAIMNPLFDPNELRKEAEVVIEESNRKYDNAAAVSLERMYATAFTQHRMKRWRIGSNEVLRNIKRDDLLAFFDSVYRPENMVVSIAGDVSHEEALAVVGQTFGSIAKGNMDMKFGPHEPAQTRFRFAQSAADIKQGYAVLGWHTPGVGHADEVGLDVLASLLGEGRSSRLFVNTIGPGAASTVHASHDTFGDVGVFSIQASFDESNRLEVERRTISEVERMKAWGPTEFELQLAKNRLESALVLSLQDALGQARQLAQFEARYGYAQIGKRLAAMNKLMPGEIREIARRYLVLDNLTLYHYSPNGTPEITPDAALALVHGAAASVSDAIKAQPLPADGKPVASAAADRPATEFRLANGARLVVRERPGAPVISTNIYFRGGRSDESTRNAGITQLMMRALRKGTKARSGEMIDQQIEYLGSNFNVVVEADYFGLGFEMLSRNYRLGLGIAADMLHQPLFSEVGVEQEKFQQFGQIKRNYDSSMARPVELAFEIMYGSHPYGLPASGYPASLADIDSARLKEWHATRIRAEDALIVIVGDISSNAARQLAEESFGWLPKRATARKALAKPTPPVARKDVLEYRDRKQSAIVFLFPTVTRGHPDWPALRLLGNVTSGLAGTFFAELRGKRSLAYTVFAQDNSRASDGLFLAYLATDAKKEQVATQALLDEIRRLAVDGFGEGDVKTAKIYFSGSTRIGRQTNAALNRELATNLMFGLGLDFTDRILDSTSKLTADDLRAVAKKYLTGAGFVGAVQKGRP